MRPVDEREFSRLLTEATAATEPIALVGGGSKDGIGRPMNAATTVSTKGLRGITLYESSEMVMSARAAIAATAVMSLAAAKRAKAPSRVSSPPTYPARGASASARRATIFSAYAR